MCKLTAELVGTDKQLLREMLNRLELSSGNPGIDVRLTGEIYGKLHMKMRELSLDPNDTTPRELYQSLLNLAALHDSFLSTRIGVNDRTDPGSVLPTVVGFINRIHMPKQVWALKPVAAKRMLKVMPPKTLMKLLHYRSVDSMLKREPISLLLTLAGHLEPEIWQHRLIQSYKKLTPSDFEVRRIDITYLDDPRWQMVSEEFAKAKRTPIIHNAETGNIIVLPMKSLPQHYGLTMTSLLLILHYINDIRTYSTFYKFHHMRPDFGKFLVRTIEGNNNEHARLAGQPIHWRTIHHYYGSNPRLQHPEIFDPHLQPEDLEYRKAEAVLFRIEPALHFWNDLDFVGLPLEDGTISFSLLDVSINLLNRVPYERRVSYHVRDALWNELYSRYLGQRSLERHMLQQLDEQLVPDAVVVPDLEFVW